MQYEGVANVLRQEQLGCIVLRITGPREISSIGYNDEGGDVDDDDDDDGVSSCHSTTR